MSKKIKLMAEYNYSPLWDMETADNIDLDELPLSRVVRQKLNDWAQIYDQIIDWNDPANSDFPNESARDAFEQQGLALWQQLQAELYPHYQISYFSEKQHQLLTPVDVEATIKGKRN